MTLCRSTKMKTQAKIRDITQTIDGRIIISFLCGDGNLLELEELQGADIDITIEKHRKKRSLNANAYLWVLCDKIAQKVGYISREDVYIDMLKNYGRFEDVLIREDAARSFMRMCKYKEILYEMDGWTCIRVYQGSHEYNSKEMSILVDGVVAEAQELGIETLTPDEIARMEATWNG